jgi:hypothetical protein
MKTRNIFLFFRIGFILMFIVVGLYLPIPSLNETWLSTFYSSVFKGLSALLGILFASFIFFRSTIDKMLYSKSYGAEWPLIILTEIGLSLLASILGLWLIPYIKSWLPRVQLEPTFVLLGLTILTIVDVIIFISYSLGLDVGNYHANNRQIDDEMTS